MNVMDWQLMVLLAPTMALVIFVAADAIKSRRNRSCR